MYIASLGTYNVEYNLELKFCEPGGVGGCLFQQNKNDLRT
jgi:hypothetical protein